MDDREKTCIESCGLKSLKAVQRSGIRFAEYQQTQSQARNAGMDGGRMS